ncbi:MAG: YaaA family protein [Candidatus Saccharimonadales bacterium]
MLTPSKTMDFITPVPDFVTPGRPLFEHESKQIRSLLCNYNEKTIIKLMHVSPILAERVRTMYADITSQKAALWTYSGDVFKGFQAATLTQADSAFAQRHLLIPSAVYGLLRPNDMIRPYRLEMKAKLAVGSSKDLYQFWGERLAEYMTHREELADTVCVLASDEYARAAICALPKHIRLVTPVFLDTKPNGTIGAVPIYSKMMRGVMGRWIIEHRINDPERLREFSGQEYHYNSAHSRPNRPAFYRVVPSPLRFLQ